VAHDLPQGLSLCDLGTHRLKDLREPKRIFQLVAADLPADFPPLRTLLASSHNLPPQPTPFVGREREIAAVRRRLLEPDVRLLTLTGVGGTGKTRLAIRVASELQDVFADGVYFVNLAPICDASLVVPAIAQTLSVREPGSPFALEALTSYLRDRHLLLLLDNFEQVTAAAPLIAELLATTRQLKVIVTSREVLHLAGEYEFPVPPLELPDLKQLPALHAISQYEAVALFIQRAQAVKPDFLVTNANAPAVAEICIRLDGLPLAIELAAARSKVLPPHALLERLNSRLKVLTGGARDLPPRQQTLRGAIDWSYDLLDQSERAFFRQLSVFVGGCTLEAVEAVCAIDGDPAFDVLNGMQSLLDKSLVRQLDDPAGEPRFAMLDTVREYAFERLQASSEFEELRRRHAMYYVRHAEASKPATDGADLAAWLHYLEPELANLRAALDWMLGRSETELALRLFATLQPFCQGHEQHGEDVCRSGACTICQTVFRRTPLPAH
jgi:predicted ATPase